MEKTAALRSASVDEAGARIVTVVLDRLPVALYWQRQS
jgi:hypothetical protein